MPHADFNARKSVNAQKLCIEDLELLLMTNNLVRFCFFLTSYMCFSCLISPVSLNLCWEAESVNTVYAPQLTLPPL